MRRRDLLDDEEAWSRWEELTLADGLDPPDDGPSRLDDLDEYADEVEPLIESQWDERERRAR